MTLIDNWKKVVTTSWSARLAYVAAFLSAMEAALPMFEIVFPKGAFAILAVAVSSLSAVARVVKQSELHANG